MRLGLSLWPDRSVSAMAELAVAAEDAGFDEVWWPDHYYLREFSAIATLAAMRTTHILLGAAVTSFLLRHPAVLASMFATLSELAGGRIRAGVGFGGSDVTADLGVGTSSPLGATREAVRIMGDLLEGKEVSLPEARHFPVHRARLGFQPAQRVPIYLAARGLRMIELAGEIADGLIAHGLAPSYLRLVRDQVASGAGKAGRGEASCDVAVMLSVALHDDIAHARDILRPFCLLMAGGTYAEDLIPLYGLDPDKVKPLKLAVATRDARAVDLLDDKMVDAFAVGGPFERIVERLSRLREVGIEHVILGPRPDPTPATLRQLGRIKEVLG